MNIRDCTMPLKLAPPCIAFDVSTVSLGVSPVSVRVKLGKVLPNWIISRVIEGSTSCRSLEVYITSLAVSFSVSSVSMSCIKVLSPSRYPIFLFALKPTVHSLLTYLSSSRSLPHDIERLTLLYVQTPKVSLKTSKAFDPKGTSDLKLVTAFFP